MANIHSMVYGVIVPVLSAIISPKRKRDNMGKIGKILSLFLDTTWETKIIKANANTATT